jgi:hypothetical protein
VSLRASSCASAASTEKSSWPQVPDAPIRHQSLPKRAIRSPRSSLSVLGNQSAAAAGGVGIPRASWRRVPPSVAGPKASTAPRVVM